MRSLFLLSALMLFIVGCGSKKLDPAGQVAGVSIPVTVSFDGAGDVPNTGMLFLVLVSGEDGSIAATHRIFYNEAEGRNLAQRRFFLPYNTKDVKVGTTYSLHGMIRAADPVSEKAAGWNPGREPITHVGVAPQVLQGSTAGFGPATLPMISATGGALSVISTPGW